MKRRATAASIVAAAVPLKDAHHKRHEISPGCLTRSCAKRVWRKHHPRAHEASVWIADSTSFCLAGTMADGQSVHLGAVASNRHPLGTRIRLLGQMFLGRRDFTVEDRIGSGSDLDLWAPSCSASMAWGRQTVRYVVVGS